MFSDNESRLLQRAISTARHVLDKKVVDVLNWKNISDQCFQTKANEVINEDKALEALYRKISEDSKKTDYILWSNKRTGRGDIVKTILCHFPTKPTANEVLQSSKLQSINSSDAADLILRNIVFLGYGVNEDYSWLSLEPNKLPDFIKI